MLGGCSSHNTLISFQPLPSDWDAWAALGCAGWGAADMAPYFERLADTIVPVAEKDRNPVARDFVTSATQALGVPEIKDFNAAPFTEGAGFFSLAYDPETGVRSSSSVAYLHPHLRRRNLTLPLDSRAYGIALENGGHARGVHVRRPDGGRTAVRARREVVLCAGAASRPSSGA